MSALRHNVALLQAAAGGSSLCAVVKANAYGHGVGLLVKALAGRRIPFWGVATLDEGLELRQLGVKAPILIFRPLAHWEPARASKAALDAIINANLQTTVADADGVDRLAGRAARLRRRTLVQIKVNTGMNRNGCAMDDVLPLAQRIAAARPWLELEGLYSHFATAYDRDRTAARAQLQAFRSVVKQLTEQGLRPRLCHMANTGAIFNLPSAGFDLVRPGNGLYGYGSGAIPRSLRLRPVLRLEAPLLLTRQLAAGEACGYGFTFRARQPMRMGLLPVGYADGYDRRLSNCGLVSYGRRLLPVIGRVSMDFTMVDLTNAPDAVQGSYLCLISDRRADPHSVKSLATRLDTIPHEITCALGQRIERVAVP